MNLLFFIFPTALYYTVMEQLNTHKLVNLKKRMVKYNDCVYGKRILAVIDECLGEARLVSKDKDQDRRNKWLWEEVCCEDCGNSYTNDSIYKHRRDVHGKVSDRPTVDTAAIIRDMLEALRK